LEFLQKYIFESNPISLTAPLTFSCCQLLNKLSVAFVQASQKVGSVFLPAALSRVQWSDLSFVCSEASNVIVLSGSQYPWFFEIGETLTQLHNA